MPNPNTRVVSFDCGNKTTGVVIADINPPQVDIKFMDVKVLDVNTPHVAFETYLSNIITPYLDVENVVVVYESMVFFPNWKLMRLQKTLKEFCRSRGTRTMCLLPSQKYKGTSGSNKKKKDHSEATAREYLQHLPNWLMRFESIERRHDVADALMAILYLNDHPDQLTIRKKTKKKSKKQQSPRCPLAPSTKKTKRKSQKITKTSSVDVVKDVIDLSSL